MSLRVSSLPLSALLRSVAALALLACEPPREPVPAPRPSAAAPVISAAPVFSASAAPSAAPAPDGIRAEVKGKTGVVRVEDRNGFRLLTIDGVVHAAHFIASGEAPLAAYDPLVRILFAARHEDSTRTLVIGLGSGATASALESSERAVEVAEIEPAVIDVARQFFDYKGHAEVSDGLDFLRKAKDPYGLILLDAFAGTDLPTSFSTTDAVKLIREKLVPGGVVAVRLLGSPKDDTVVRIVRTYSQLFGHARFYGTGVGDEVQNLYLLLSDEPLRLYSSDMGGAVAIPLPKKDVPPGQTGARDAAAETGVRDVVMGRIERRAALVGYLVQDEDGTLCLDLPHWEMGARRYLLSGPEAERLRASIPKKATFPTAGDLSSDGDLSQTMHSLLSGGGYKLSTVRFSPVVVAVEGKLSPRTPETTGIPGGHDFNPRMFMESTVKIAANAIGVIAVDRVHFTMNTNEWRALRQKALRSHALRAQQAFAKGDLQAGATAIRAMLDALDDRFGRFAPRMVTYDELSTLLGVTSKAGATCHSARKEYRTLYSGPFWFAEGAKEKREVSSMLASLFACAVHAFEKEAGKAPKTEAQQEAAARLLALLTDAGWDEFDDKQREVFDKRFETLKEKWKIERADDP